MIFSPRSVVSRETKYESRKAEKRKETSEGKKHESREASRRDTRLAARRAVVSRNSDGASGGVVCVVAVSVVLAASDAEAVLGRLDQLDIESTVIVAWKDTEGLGRDAIISLSRRIELTSLIGRVEAAKMRCIDAAGDLTDLVHARSAPLCVSRIGEEVDWETPLVSRIVSCLVRAVSFRASPFGHTDVGMGVQRCNHAHVRERVDFDDVI